MAIPLRGVSADRPLICCGLGALPIACSWQRSAASRCRCLSDCSSLLLRPACSSSIRSASALRHASSADTALYRVRVSGSALRRHCRMCVFTICRLYASWISGSLYGVIWLSSTHVRSTSQADSTRSTTFGCQRRRLERLPSFLSAMRRRSRKSRPPVAVGVRDDETNVEFRTVMGRQQGARRTVGVGVLCDLGSKTIVERLLLFVQGSVESCCPF